MEQIIVKFVGVVVGSFGEMDPQGRTQERSGEGTVDVAVPQKKEIVGQVTVFPQESERVEKLVADVTLATRPPL